MAKEVNKSLLHDDYTDVEAKIIGVTGKGRIADIAAEKGLNPQEVFVRVIFEITDRNGVTVQTMASNQLRFFGQTGYEKLLKAKETGEMVKLSLRTNDKGTLVYLNRDNEVKMDDLFAKPIERKGLSKVEEVLKNLKF